MKYIIVGRGGSGKSYIAQKLANSLNLKLAKQHTTRPKRNKNDNEYIFEKEFNFDEFDLTLNLTHQKYEIINNNKKRMVVEYWYNDKDWNNNDIFIMPPHIAEKFYDDKDVLVIYISVDDETALRRLQDRNDKFDSAIRRFIADGKDFNNFEKYDISINNNDYTTLLKILKLLNGKKES